MKECGLNHQILKFSGSPDLKVKNLGPQEVGKAENMKMVS